MENKTYKLAEYLRHPVVRELRPRQWTKNLLVLAPLFFALGDKSQVVPAASWWKTGLAALFFCVLSSGIYVFNDILDRDLDRAHPFKKNRPVAAGEISLSAAWSLSIALTLAAIAGGIAISANLAGIMLGYIIVQLLYTLVLKHVALVDVFFISFGFVFRAIAGGVTANVPVSFWFLICTFLMALFLGLCKRRHEKHENEKDENDQTRPSLKNSDIRLLDQLIAITASATIISYAAYTQWPDTVGKFGTHGMGFTIPFVLFGIFRYLDLVYRHSEGGQPEYVLLTDTPLIINIALYVLCVLAVFGFRTCC